MIRKLRQHLIWGGGVELYTVIVNFSFLALLTVGWVLCTTLDSELCRSDDKTVALVMATMRRSRGTYVTVVNTAVSHND